MSGLYVSGYVDSINFSLPPRARWESLRRCDGLPGVCFFAHGVELGAEALEGDGAEQEAERWIGRVDDLHHGVDGAERIACLLAVLIGEVAAHVAGGGVVVGDRGGGLNAGAAEEVGTEGAGLNEGDVDAERGELPGRGIRRGLLRRTWWRCRSPCRGGDEAADGREIEDVSAAPLAEVRQEGLRDVDEAEDVGVEHGHELVFGDLLDGAGEP